MFRMFFDDQPHFSSLNDVGLYNEAVEMVEVDIQSR